MTAPDRDPTVWNGAVEILAATKNVVPEHRLDAFALAAAALITTNFTLEVTQW